MEIYLTSSVRVSSPLVQMTDSFRDSMTSLASHLSLRALPAFRCLSLDTIRPESSVIVNSGAVIEKTHTTSRIFLRLRSLLPLNNGGCPRVLYGFYTGRGENFIFPGDIKDKQAATAPNARGPRQLLPTVIKARFFRASSSSSSRPPPSVSLPLPTVVLNFQRGSGGLRARLRGPALNYTTAKRNVFIINSRKTAARVRDPRRTNLHRIIKATGEIRPEKLVTRCLRRRLLRRSAIKIGDDRPSSSSGARLVLDILSETGLTLVTGSRGIIRD